MKLTTDDYNKIKVLQDSGVSNNIIATLYKTKYSTFMRHLKHYENEHNTE